MADFYLDPVTHDLVLDDDKGLQMIDGLEEIVQRVKITLLAHKGEWLFDTEFGVPYRDQILVKNPNMAQIEAASRVVIAAVPGVTRILALKLTLDGATRKLTVQGDIETDEGPTSFSITP